MAASIADDPLTIAAETTTSSPLLNQALTPEEQHLDTISHDTMSVGSGSMTKETSPVANCYMRDTIMSLHRYDF
jgi:hypothetical protein